MERVKLLIYLIIFVFVVWLIVKHWRTGRKD